MPYDHVYTELGLCDFYTVLHVHGKEITIHLIKGDISERFTESTAFTRAVENVAMPHSLPDGEYLARAADADVIVADAIAPVSRGLLEGMPGLRLVHSNGVGFNRVDVRAATELGIPVCNCRGMNALATAEQAVMLMLGLLRDVVNNDRAVREGRQLAVKEGYMVRGDLRELADCSVGLVGFGDIGSKTAALLRAFGCTELFYTKRSPLPPAEEKEHGVRFLPLDDLLARCDIVSLHLPASAETERMADARFFSRMKEGSLFINAARGELVDDGALIAALEQGRPAAAGLDTLSGEPVTAGHPLLRASQIADRLLLAPHIGGITASSFRRAYRIIWANIERISRGESPDHCVNPEVLRG